MPLSTNIKVLSKENIYDLKLETATEDIKLFIQKNTRILLFGNYLQQVGRERTVGNPGRHHREVKNLARRLLKFNFDQFDQQWRIFNGK